MAEPIEDRLARAGEAAHTDVDADAIWQRGRRRRARKRALGGVAAGAVALLVAVPAVERLAGPGPAAVVVGEGEGGPVDPACVAAAADAQPGDPVGRGQAAVALVDVLRGIGVEPVQAPDRFTDDAGAEATAVDQLAARGIVIGRSQDTTTFDPAGPLTRGQLASLAVRTYGVMVGGGLPDAGDRFYDDDRLPHEADLDVAWASGLISGRMDSSVEPEAPATTRELDETLARLRALLLGADPEGCR